MLFHVWLVVAFRNSVCTLRAFARAVNPSDAVGARMLRVFCSHELGVGNIISAWASSEWDHEKYRDIFRRVSCGRLGRDSIG